MLKSFMISNFKLENIVLWYETNLDMGRDFSFSMFSDL